VSRVFHGAAAALTCWMLAGPVAAQPERITPEQFRTRINDALGSRGLKLQLKPWAPAAMGPGVLSSGLTRNISVIAEVDGDDCLSTVLFLMRTGKTMESVTQVVAALTAATYAANPELRDDRRLELLDELGLFERNWVANGLAGTAVRNAVTYLVIHPGGDPLVILLLCWPARHEPAGEGML